jgi:hypothetical protein
MMPFMWAGIELSMFFTKITRGKTRETTGPKFDQWGALRGH